MKTALYLFVGLVSSVTHANEICRNLPQKINTINTRSHLTTETIYQNVCIELSTETGTNEKVVIDRMMFDGTAIPQIGVQSTYDNICKTFGFQLSKLTLGSEEYSVISRSVPFWFQSKKRLFLGMFDTEDGYKVVEKLECLK